MFDANVKRLSDYKEKLILFPKHESKPKKGEIHDSTAEKLTKVEQNTTLGVFSMPALKKRSKPEALTKDISNARIYRKLRQERVNAKYNGKRVKAAKLAEESKK